MELLWEDIPPDDGPFFTRELYDKYSIAPNVKELWAIVQSQSSAEVQGKSSGVSGSDSACGEGHDSDEGSADDHHDKNLKSLEAYPEPRVPFPCVSSLTSQDQQTYLRALTSCPPKKPPQNLCVRVSSEVSQFMLHLQNVARMCAEDYNVLSQGAGLYTDEFFRACLEHIKTYPQSYRIHEMTSLTGGTFNPGLSLAFEKQLLVMGNVEITDHQILPNDAQLASDYERVSSENPPAKKARDTLATIGDDGNAEKLCARYEPHVCLTRDALVQLLDNHGPEFADAWELPLWVKTGPGKGSGQRKTVFIDSPLLKTEVSVRERSHIYHEESLKLSIKKDGQKNVFHLLTEVPTAVQYAPVESSRGSLVPLEDTGLDFDVDLTDLETFGESASGKFSKKPASRKKRSAPVETEPPARSESEAKLSESSAATEKESGAPEEEEQGEESSTEEPAETTESKPSPAVHRSKRLRRIVDTDKSEEEQLVIADATFGGGDSEDEQLVIADARCSGDSEDEQLVIDDPLSLDAPPDKQPQKTAKTKTAPQSSLQPPETPLSSAESVLGPPRAPSPQRDGARPGPASPPATRPKRGPKRAKVPGDQLGQILRMQKAMLKPSQSQDPAKASSSSSSSSQPAGPFSPPWAAGAPGHGHPQSLVKPCVSSYLESGRSMDDGGTYAVAAAGPVSDSTTTTEPKRLLSEELLVSAEDEQDYQAPAEGNLLYKLYSLQDVLLMVRSSVALAHSRRIGPDGPNQLVPVHVLPKMEYQLSYGVECLTSHEACQLWAETLLHSSTVSYVGHISAHTSRLALLRNLPADWKRSVSCDFKPAKSLNILHHLLKKTTVLEAGRYLLSHKAGEPFVTIFRAAGEESKASCGAYDLRRAHGGVPPPPTARGHAPPWVPVDPNVALPFHRRHGRVPCTFPPKDPRKSKAVPPQTNPNQEDKKKKKKKKNKGAWAKRRDVWIQKTVQRHRGKNAL